MVRYYHGKLQEFFVISCKTSYVKKVNEKEEILAKSSEEYFGAQKTYS